MPVLVTSNFDDDSIKNERGSMATAFFHISLWEFFRRSRAANSVVSGLIWPKRQLVRDFIHVSFLQVFKGSDKKTTEKRCHHFPHDKSMGAFCCHGNQGFDPICPKTLCSLSPTPFMLHIKFDQDWLTGFRDIKV